MSEKKRPLLDTEWILKLSVLVLAALFVYFTVSNLLGFRLFPEKHEGEEDVMGYKDSEITEMIATENRELKQLIVYEQDIKASMDITDMFLNIEWFKKKQTVHLEARAEYIVDLSKISSQDVTIDRAEKRITVIIPRAELKTVNIDFTKTTFDDIERNIFGWGDIKLTPEQQNEVEKDLQEALFAEASGSPYLASADLAAMRQVESVYRKILKNLDSSVEIAAVLDMEIAD